MKKIVSEAIDLLKEIGIITESTTKLRSERIAISMLAIAGIKEHWKEAKSLKDGRKITTREIIDYVNINFDQNISRGSYDDVRRIDIRPLQDLKLVINSGDNPNANISDPTRGYSLDHAFKQLIASYGTKSWGDNKIKTMKIYNLVISNKLNKPIISITVTIENNKTIELKPSAHNLLQKEIIEVFLEKHCPKSKILYLGDSDNKFLYIDEDSLRVNGVSDLKSGKIPDVIAHYTSKNWLIVVEAVTSSGPVSSSRLMHLKQMFSNSSAGLVFVTAFLDRATFRKHVSEISWETEVWIASEPDHLIHFDGKRFLGPY